VLIDPPWEEYARRAPGAPGLDDAWLWQDIQALDIAAVADTPSFVFLWCARRLVGILLGFRRYQGLPGRGQCIQETSCSGWRLCTWRDDSDTQLLQCRIRASRGEHALQLLRVVHVPEGLHGVDPAQAGLLQG